MCVRLDQVLEITKLEWNSPLETMAWAEAETPKKSMEQISTAFVLVHPFPERNRSGTGIR